MRLVRATYIGKEPGLVGVDQLRFQIPPDAPEGCAVPFRVLAGPIASQPVPLSIHTGRGTCVPAPVSLADIEWVRSVTQSDPAKEFIHMAPDGVMKNYSYLPAALSVKAGQAVTIYNDDVVAHTLTLDDRSLDSRQIRAGASYSFRMTEPGEYPFH